ncbi:MAG: 4Fe-4S dicluster domain-containing protein [Desulfosalsimonadaceae bacterium]
MKRSFFGFIKPRLTYEAIVDSDAEPADVPVSEKIQLLLDAPLEHSQDLAVAAGEHVKSGQCLRATADSDDYGLASRSGKITDVRPFIGMMQKKMTAVSITVDPESEQVPDEEFKKQSKNPSLEAAACFLKGLPGKPDFSPFFDPGRRIKAIVVLGAEHDLLAITNQYFVKTSIESIKTGIDALRKMTGIQNVILAVPEHLVQVAGAAGAGVKTVDSEYPTANPELIVRHILSDEIKAGGEGRNADVAFFNAEAVSAIGAAFNTGRLPLTKMATFISKDGSRRMVSVPMGTPVKNILDTFNETLEEGDRLIFGGPMTGTAVYTIEQPVAADTDVIMIQDSSRIPESSGTACINCGECVRVCPVNIPVNILVRLLEAEQYEQAAAQAELDACIECGLCAFVCESRIPIFQHIKLGKHMLERMKAEESNA